MGGLMAKLRRERWSPYWTGAGIGLLGVFTFSVMDKALGASTTVVRAVGATKRGLTPELYEETPYLVKYLGALGEPKPLIEWQFALMIFAAIGAWVAARFFGGGGAPGEELPPLWSSQHGGSITRRRVAAFAGGAIMLFGARLAGGCTSGHAISGGMQFALSSWLFIPLFMASAFAVGLVTLGRR